MKKKNAEFRFILTRHALLKIIHNIVASRYVTNMETFGFVQNERGRLQFRFYIYSFWPKYC